METEIQIDLQRPPADRWHFSPAQAEFARRLASTYWRDLGDAAGIGVDHIRLDPVHAQEVDGIAARLGVEREVMGVVNLYYDLIKSAFACTAFAIDSPAGPLHARNLDWWTDERLLHEGSLAAKFVGGDHGDFTLVGWPGFAGAFSGVAPGRFAITLNSVLSDEPAPVADSVTFLIRDVLESAPDYLTALDRLCRTPIACDALLLISGTEPGQMAVVERTPRRFAVRGPEYGADVGPARIRVTNDYRALEVSDRGGGSVIVETSCGRFDSIGERLATEPPDADGCLEYLDDPSVRMTITVQQMVFRAGDGLCRWRQG